MYFHAKGSDIIKMPAKRAWVYKKKHQPEKGVQWHVPSAENGRAYSLRQLSVWSGKVDDGRKHYFSTTIELSLNLVSKAWQCQERYCTLRQPQGRFQRSLSSHVRTRIWLKFMQHSCLSLLWTFCGTLPKDVSSQLFLTGSKPITIGFEF